MEPWEKNLQKLEQFFKRHGHCDVPSDWKPDPILAQWVENIRTSHKRLPTKLIRELKKLKFNFDSNDGKTWDSMYTQLVYFWKKHGHTYVPYNNSYDKLSQWVQNQRNAKSQLRVKHITKLDNVQFDWFTPNKKRNDWEFMFQELKRYKERNGHTKLVHTDKENAKLVQWVHNIRARPQQLDNERKKRLSALGFLWREDLKKLVENKWLQRYKELKEFKKRFGHCDVPIHWKENDKLSVWVSENRLREKRSVLLPERKKMLDMIGFSWSKDLVAQYDQNWYGMFEKFKAFLAKHGHQRVPSTKKYKELKSWVLSQRIMVKRGYLAKEKVKELEFAGFIWQNIRGVQWEKLYNQAKEYKKKYKTLNISGKNSGQHKVLLNWLSLQRQRRYKGILSKERIKRLDAIGFDWSLIPPEVRWKEKFEALVLFKKKFKHVHIPATDPQYASLYKWITRQRSKHTKGILEIDQHKMLIKAGVDLSPVMETIWWNQYQALAAFEKKYHHFLLPTTVTKYKSLSRWMSVQREAYRNGTLLKVRYRMLEAIGFDWHPKIGRRKEKG